MEAFRLTVKGRVQGVGFRYFVCRQAERFGISGWVRNLPNGDVEAHAQGEAEALTQFVTAVRRGPAMAFVVDLQQEPVPVVECAGFAVKGWG
ncbi:MAG: acylphosphatase [Acidobacteriota bacterium]